MTEPVEKEDGGVPHLRRIRTFMARSSALSTSQKRGLEEFGPRLLHKRPDSGLLDLAALFGREAPLTVEIGFGMGYSLVEMALAAPERNFIGIEIHQPGLAQICHEAGTRAMNNLQVFDADALLLLENNFADGSIDTVQLFFPDPWPKKKHFKRRLVQAANAELIRRKLKVGGIFHMATDWENYAEWMRDVMEAQAGFRNLSGPGAFAERPAHRPLTKFEQRGQKLGHGAWDLLYVREA
jgi:tRNA (guanine-N7-)-methyltransferase